MCAARSPIRYSQQQDLTSISSFVAAASHQSMKYQKRWFELTAETLVYAKDPLDLKGAAEGRLEVFAVHELRHVKLVDEWKIEVRV